MQPAIRFSRNERGQSMVELAISITFILFLLSGMVDLGMAFFSFVALRDAAQDGAIYAAIEPVIDNNGNGIYDDDEPLNTAAIETRIRNASSTPIDLTDTTQVSVNIDFSGEPCAGNAVTVSATYNYVIHVPLMGSILGTNTIPITASVTNTILSPACP